MLWSELYGLTYRDVTSLLRSGVHTLHLDDLLSGKEFPLVVGASLILWTDLLLESPAVPQIHPQVFFSAFGVYLAIKVHSEHGLDALLVYLCYLTRPTISTKNLGREI